MRAFWRWALTGGLALAACATDALAQAPAGPGIPVGRTGINPTEQDRSADEPAASGKAAQPAIPAEPLAPGPAFTDALRAKFASELRGTSGEGRAAVLRELGQYRSPEATRLILQFGLRDRNPVLQSAARQALTTARGDDSVERFLADQLRQEVFAKRRGPLDYVGRLAGVVGDMRSTSGVETLLTLSAECDATLSPLLLDGLLTAFDRAGAERDERALPALERAASKSLTDQSPGLRKCCIDAVRQMEHPRAIELLIRWLPSLDGELRGDVVGHLQRVTGNKGMHDPAEWSRWWKTHGADFKLTEHATNDEPLARSGSPLYYYDLPVQAQRLVFVLDTSKSMEAGGKKSRLAAAQDELVRTIERLPESTRFGIVAFSSEVVPWQPRLAPASAANRAHAIAFVRAQRPAGETATYDALQAAFEMAPDLETVYFLSDGSPSAGAILAPDKLLEAIHRDNRFRRVKIHALGAFAGAQTGGPQTGGPQTIKLEEFMRKLAAENYGQFRRLD